MRFRLNVVHFNLKHHVLLTKCNDFSLKSLHLVLKVLVLLVKHRVLYAKHLVLYAKHHVLLVKVLRVRNKNVRVLEWNVRNMGDILYEFQILAQRWSMRENPSIALLYF